MATETMDAAGPGRGGRMSRRRKRDAVLRLLRGEDLETVSRSLGVTAAALTGWRDAFLAAGEASLATRPTGLWPKLGDGWVRKAAYRGGWKPA
jgi:transposase